MTKSHRGIQSIAVGGTAMPTARTATRRAQPREAIPGANALSAPVFDHTHGIVLAVAAMGPVGSFDPARDSALACACASARPWCRSGSSTRPDAAAPAPLDNPERRKSCAGRAPT